MYTGGDAYSAAAVYIKQDGKWALHYILRDYLGSITHVTNANGAVEQELSYDAWGNLRDPKTHVVYVLGRGALIGTERHKYASGLVNDYQSEFGTRGLETNFRFGDVTTKGQGGYFDVLDIKNNTVFDWKFGYPNKTVEQFLKTPQMIKYQNYDLNMKIIIIHVK